MCINKKHKLMNDKKILNNEYEEFSVMNRKVKPEVTALKLIGLYLTIGVLWILLSDRLLNMVVKSGAVFKKMQLYKGWFYVFITGIIFFLIIYKSLRLYKEALDYVLKGYEELTATYEELMAMNEELDEQNNELERQAEERKILEEKLEALAYYDPLTELPNRIFFERKINSFIEQNRKIAIINVDIDDLKHINDMFGQDAGNTYLKYIANILSKVMVQPNIIAHLNGNQFAIAYIIEDEDDLDIKLQLLFDQIRIPWEFNDEKLFVTASAGLATFPEHGDTFATLMQNAEIAMFKQKEMGKDGYTFFQSIMYEETLKISEMNTQLRKAIENEEFVLNYQPQFDLITGKMIAAESLIRWIHPKKGIIPPMDFIPLSEKTGQIIPISMWVLKTAITQKREWEKKGYPSLKIAVNMSGYVIANEAIVDTICEMLESMDIKPGEIEIEVTETAVMLDLEKAKESLLRLRSYGISIAMDDFGTGYSSLTYLHTLPFDILKMDREFIKNIKTKDEDNFIYKTIIDLAHNMDLTIVAEGIETKEQKEFLLKNNCDIGQGYYFSKPIAASEIEKILTK